jgi:filamentous hemagglutinin
MGIIKQVTALWVSYTLVMMPLYAAGVQVDGTTNTTLETAPNGTQVVNIANPNATGLSHNKFTQYNVDSKGLILNNCASTTTNTQLAGHIYGNPNLNKSAKVILNEVTSSSRSNLAGFTEVAGPRADLVIANPNGITLNGAGFINTSNITLTTGRPIINAGRIDYFDVRGGDISIQGNGLDTRGQESAYLYSHYLTVNAKIHADNLDIQLGKNQINYDDKTIRGSENSGATGLLLDASALGGMYANRINLVGTDSGLGVNLPPEVLASNGDITISNDGHISLQKITASHMVNVSGTGDVNTNDTVYAKNVNINAQDSLNNNALLSAKDNIALTTENLNNTDTITAGMNADASANILGELIVTADTITNTGNLQATKQLTTRAQTLNNNNGQIISSQDAIIDVSALQLNNSNIYATNNLNIETNTLNNVATSSIQAGNNLQVDASGDITNASDLLAGGLLTLNVNGDITNNKVISSQSVLNLNGNALVNNDTISGGSGTSTSTIVMLNGITNNARISSANNLEVQGGDITNNGFFSSGNDLQITSTNLTNNQTLFSANDMRLYTTNSVINNEAANIYAFNDLTMAANAANGRTNSIDNISAFIETYQGDINLYASTFTNKRSRDMNDAVFLTSSSLSDSVYLDQFMANNTGANGLVTATRVNGDNFTFDVPGYGFKVYMDLAAEPFSYHFTTLGVVVNEQTPYDNPNYRAASLLAGRNLNINANNVINEMSNIASVNDMNINVDNSFINRTNQYSGNINLTNYGTVVLTEELYNAIPSYRRNSYEVGDTVHTSQTSYFLRNGEIIKTVVNAYGNYSYGTYALTSNNPAHVLSSVTAGGNININTPILGNGAIKENEPVTNANVMAQETGSIGAQGDVITLPVNDFGLFVTNQDSDANYLIETNPEFTFYANFIGSNYLLDRLDLDPELTTRRLGDDFYENRLVSQSILSQTGQRFLDESITSDMQQFTYLMDNALAEKVNLELIPGVALTKEQVQALTSDIVWMEEQEVHGHKVLVPVVYIANAKSYKLEGAKIVASENLNLNVQNLQNSGALQAGESIALNVNTLTNTKQIHAKHDLHVNATDKIDNINGTLQADKDVHITAKNDINNISATIKGENVALASTEGSVNNKMYAKDATYSGARFINKTTHVGDASTIEASKNLDITAKDTIHNQGSQLNGQDVSLQANDITIDTVVKNKDMFVGDGDNYNIVKATHNYTSEVNAKNLQLTASDTVLLKGAALNAQEDINVKTRQVDIASVNNAHYEETKRTTKHTFSKETTTTKKATSTNVASTLNAKNISIETTENDINVVGSKLEAEKTLALNSANNININAGYDGTMNEAHTTKSGFFSGGKLYSKTEDLEGKLTKIAVNSELTGKDIQLSANKNIEVVGADLHANESLSAQAQDISIKNATNTEETYSKHTNISVGLGDTIKSFSSMVVNPLESVEYENGQASVVLATANYDKETKRTLKTTVASSNVSGKNINLNASSTENDKGNILIQGSNLDAEENIDLSASNDITIKEAKETTEHQSKETHGEAELKATVKNEYVQITYALENVKKATQALKKAKDDYSQYKSEVSKQETKLAQLEEHYKNKTGFIELVDVEEMRELLDDLKDDKKFYETNIALATATLATKTTALATQGAKAASSSGTYGFNAGLELDIDAIEKQLREYEEKSVASNLNAKNINLSAQKKATVQGSNLNAKESININAKELDVIASVDAKQSDSSSAHQNINISIDMYSGPEAVVSADKSNSTSAQSKYNNATLNAKNITINTQETTSIKGANLKAEDTLAITTKNLEVASVQDKTNSRSDSQGMSVGFGPDTINSVGGNFSKSRSDSKEIVQTDLTGQSVVINTAENTTLKGATIAAVDQEGNDNGQLTLNTGTLTVSSLNNTHNSKSTSLNAQVGGSVKDNTASNVSLDFSQDRTNTKTKTLATLGSGTINVADQDNSDTTMLNRDIKNNEVDVYDVTSHKELKGELDTNLLTENGRNQIVDDLIKTKFIATTLVETAMKQSASLAGDTASGETGFFENVQNKSDLFDGTKKFVNDPANAEARDTLLNPNAIPEELKKAQQALHTYVANEMGIEPAELQLILDKQYKGFTSSEDGKVRIAANLHNTMGDMANTTLNETSDVADLRRDAGVEKNEFYKDNRDEYSRDFGELGANLLDRQYANTTGSSIKNTAYNKVGTDLSKPAQLNKTVITNTKKFNQMDKSKGAHRQLKTAEIKFIKDNAKAYAEQKYKTDTPTPEQIQGAEYELGQEALRQVDLVWQVVLGKENTQAKTFLEKTSEGKSFTNSRNEQQQFFTNANGGFYDPTRYADESVKANPELFKQAQMTAGETLKNPDEIATKVVNKIKEEATFENLLAIADAFIKDNQNKDVDDLIKEKYVDIGTTVADGIETGLGVKNTSAKTLDTIYGEGSGDAIKGIATTLVVGSVVGNGKNGKSPKSGIDTRKELEQIHGKENVTSTTVVTNPRQSSSTRADVITDANGNKAVEVKWGDGTTKRIPYDNDRKLPIFDDVSEFITKITKPDGYKNMTDKTRKKLEMQQASRDMWEAIKSDDRAKSKFTKQQLNDMESGKEKIAGFTWHHNAQSSPSNMQLIPTPIHEAARHIGEAGLSKGI